MRGVERSTIRAVRYARSVPRYLAVRLAGRWWPQACTGFLSSIRLVEVKAPPLPTPRWVRIRPILSGICGSDLATIGAKGSLYFSALTSTPFVLGHEVVGKITEVGPEAEGCRVGDRVVIEPALSCRIRGIAEPCAACRAGNPGGCENVGGGHVAPGVQTGYCRDTGGGWSEELVAHEAQVHRVPDDFSDELAVLIEPFSCAVHAALRAGPPRDDALVLVIGCGTMGILTIAALRAVGSRCRILAAAKHPHQEEFARTVGADLIVAPGRDLSAQVSAASGARCHRPEVGRPFLLGGVDVAFDCVGTTGSLDAALRLTRARGAVILVGMPGIPGRLDWTPIWHKELAAMGSYTYGTEAFQGESLGTFDLAIRLLDKMGHRLAGLVGARYLLADYRRALRRALQPGKSQAIKIVLAP